MFLKKNILESVSQQLANGGLLEIKMDGVAKEAGVSKKTLYKLFGSKQAMLDEALHYYLKNTVQQIEGAAKGSGSAKRRILRAEIIAFDAIHGLFPNQWQTFDDKAKERENPLRLFFHHYLYTIIKDLLIEGVRDQSLDNRIEFDLVTRKILFNLNGVLEYGQKEVEKRGKKETFHYCSGLYLKGLEKRRLQLA